MCALLIPGLIAAGALALGSGMGCDTGCATACAPACPPNPCYTASYGHAGGYGYAPAGGYHTSSYGYGGSYAPAGGYSAGIDAGGMQMGMHSGPQGGHVNVNY